MSPDEKPRPTRERIRYGAAPQQFGDLTLPDSAGPHPVIVFIHGGFWRERYDLSLAEPQAADAVARGWATWNIEYRRVGHVGGGFPGTLEDVATAVDHLAELAIDHPLDLSRVAVVGHSAGGHLSLWIGQRSRLPESAGWRLPLVKPGLVVGQAPVADLTAAVADDLGRGAVAAMIGDKPSAVPQRYAVADPSRLLPVDVPQFIVHGSADDTVPINSSRGYERLVADIDKLELAEFEGADHFDVIDPAHQSWTLVRERISRLLNG